MIPKIIHYCWFGGSPLPNEALMCISSWKKYLPDYEIKEWNESNFDIHICPYVWEAYQKKKYAFVSDYVRYHVLYNEGGLYFDTDVEIIKNMDHIINSGNFMGIEKSFATHHNYKGFFIGVNPGLGLGVNPGLNFISEILELYQSKPHFLVEDGTVVDYTTGILKKYGLVNENKLQKIADILIYPTDFFCPIDSTTGIKSITHNTVSIHHYSCSWIDHNTLSWRMHKLKNLLIKFMGEKWIMKICRFFRLYTS